MDVNGYSGLDIKDFLYLSEEKPPFTLNISLIKFYLSYIHCQYLRFLCFFEDKRPFVLVPLYLSLYNFYLPLTIGRSLMPVLILEIFWQNVYSFWSISALYQ